MKSMLGAALALALGLGLAAGSVAVVVNGTASTMPGFAAGNTIFVSARTFLPALGASVVRLSPNKASVKLCGKTTDLAFEVRDATPFMDGVLSARALGFQVSASGTTLTVTGDAGNCAPANPTAPPGIGYNATFTSTMSLKDGGSGYTYYTYRLEGHAVLSEARAGETYLQGSDLPVGAPFTILAEGRLDLSYESVTLSPPKCPIVGRNGFAYLMLLETTLPKGGKLRVIAFDPGLPGGRGLAPSETVQCPRALGLQGWYSAFTNSVKGNLGVVIVSQDSPRPALLLNGLPELTPSATVEYSVGNNAPLKIGKATLIQDTRLKLEPIK